MTPDSFFYPVAALVVVALIALAMVYPQGEGARSPGPFGHTPTQQTAAAIAQARHDAAAAQQQKQAAAALQAQQKQAPKAGLRSDLLK
jgi:Flp pilus assembly protein TadB